jgi:ABC-type polysaccharide/polyol phosphate transport system ATPase subunit
VFGCKIEIVKPIIEVRNVSKKYKIGERQRYLSLRDSVSNLFSSKNTEGPPFWALDDVLGVQSILTCLGFQIH